MTKREKKLLNNERKFQKELEIDRVRILKDENKYYGSHRLNI